MMGKRKTKSGDEVSSAQGIHLRVGEGFKQPARFRGFSWWKILRQKSLTGGERGMGEEPRATLAHF